MFAEYLKKRNILPQTIFTQKYPTVNFSQTTVVGIATYDANGTSY